MYKTILLFISISSFFPQHTEYFSTVAFVESPYSGIRGSVPLSKNVALKRNHYRFEYNEINQLTQIAFYNGTVLRNRNHTANLFFQSAQIKISYPKNKIVYAYYDRFDKRTEILDNTHQFVFVLNEDGFKESLYFTNKKRERVENGWGIYSYKWTLEDKGTVIEERFDKAGKAVMIRPGFDFYKLRLYYNQQSYIALMQNIDGNGNLLNNSTGVAQDRIKTNAQGNFLEWNVLDNKGNLKRGNGPMVAKGIQSFNEFGYETGIRYKDESGEAMATAYGYWNSITHFDRFGNMEHRTFLNKDDKPVAHENAGYVHLKITWDKTGLMREKLEYFDINRKATAHKQRGYHKVTYKYDKNRNLLKISYFDTENNLVNRLDNNIAYIEYKYDSNNKQIERVAYNKSAEKLSK